MEINELIKPLKTYLILIVILLVANLGFQAFWVYDHFKPDPRKTSAYDKVGKFLNEKKYGEALAYCKKVLRSEPNNQDAMWGKAISLYFLERYQDARAAFVASTELNPNWTKQAHEFIVICNSKLNDNSFFEPPLSPVR